MGLNVDLNAVASEDIAGPLQRRADDLGDIDQFELELDRTGFEPGHVEKIGDEPAQPFGLILEGCEQLLTVFFAVPLWEAAKACNGAQDRGERRPQIMRN